MLFVFFAASQLGYSTRDNGVVRSVREYGVPMAAAYGEADTG